ncbi:hypothetical protein EYZ11_004199 [Aspergillus tanneri]|uniref:HIG1 domain-containing protein n=1 Tax=Aspergillus tanneri TaxID=1220188 RepID=A0A4S3JLR7_9EURO|nr:uncharacterized protein ATNIH1004_000779 [Aspergillus tanneri]KAA8651881.1 hypothetical protein ATNIH1004_000779 [Aspergillus tanneri]THC96340.1 hypothetical protein EYZ11_004199 [Aspergillus tanneri]
MKILTKEEEDAHYSTVVKGGTLGTVLGLAAGVAGVMLASRRSQTIRNLTLPMKTFLVTSSGTFVGIIAADHASRSFEAEHNEQRQWYANREERLRSEELAQMTFVDRALTWARREKYKIVGVTWAASMIGSFALVGRNPYLSGAQKIVQARVYAQGLTLAVLVASAAFEISDQRKGKGIVEASKAQKKDQTTAAAAAAASPAPAKSESEEGGDLWKDMVAAEEERLKKKRQSLYEKHGHYGHDHTNHRAPPVEDSQSTPIEKKEN